MNLLLRKRRFLWRCNWPTRPRKGARSLGRIEHYRNVCRDLETKLMKQSELLDEAVERKATLQNEINELEVRIAEEESRVPPVPPSGSSCGAGCLSPSSCG